MAELLKVLGCLVLGIIAQVDTENELKGKFWQITDIHLEEFYSSDGDVNNDCRILKNSSSRSSPIPGPFGDFNCDAPIKLVTSVLEEMKKIEPNPDFILWTGDNVPHLEDDEIDWDLVFSTIRTLTTAITNAFPDILLVPVIGNHDVHPALNYSWDILNFENYSDGYLNRSEWLPHIPVDQLDNFRKGGFYAVNVTPSFRIITLNTFLYNKRYYDEDPKGQLAWLQEDLRSARLYNEKVIITSHIPPGFYPTGSQLLSSPYQEKLYEILNDYSDVILTQIYGHLHQDTFRLFYNARGELKTHAFLSPSVTPWKYPRNASTGNNPAVRLYQYDLKSGYITDYYQYSFNLSQANSNNDTNHSESDNWSLAYKATELYNIDDLSTGSVREIYAKLVTNPRDFDKYLRFYQYGYYPDCDPYCKGYHFCAIVAQTPLQWKNCVINRQLV